MTSRILEIEDSLQYLAYAGHSGSGLSQEDAARYRERWESRAPQEVSYLLTLVDALTAQMRAAAAGLRALAVPAAQDAADRLDAAATYAHLARDEADLARLGDQGPWYPAYAPVTYLPTIDDPDGGDAA